jgi:hypothetical protein
LIYDYLERGLDLRAGNVWRTEEGARRVHRSPA